MDGRIVRCGIISSCQSTATSEIVKALRVVHHRLNGSSSHVLTATFLSNGKAKNSTLHRIKTPDLIEIKFGTVDYVG